LKESYKYKLWSRLESLGWVVIPVPASGAGKKGVHRPDLILGDGEKVYVCEVKNTKLPLYLNYTKDIEPVIVFARALSAEPIVIVKRKFSKKWKVFKITDLEKCSSKTYVINKKNIEEGINLEDFFRDSAN